MLKRLFFLLIGLCLSFQSAATPWVEPDDEYLRASLQVLADRGFLSTPINTFPLMWSNIERDLRDINHENLDDVAQFAFWRVRSALEFNKRSSTRVARLNLSSDIDHVRGFDDRGQERLNLYSSAETQGERWAGRLSVGLRGGKIGNHHYALDGSYLARIVGNWVLSVDQLPVWWGPGQDQALTLSTNARPIQTLRVSRLGSEPAPVPLLSLLGDWHVTGFLGRAQGSGTLRSGRVIGARASVKPVSALEIGGSYLRQWGDFEIDSRIYAFDFRLSVSNVGLYSELAYDDFDGNNTAWLAGADYSFGSGDKFQKVVIEYVDTQPGCGTSEAYCIYQGIDDYEGLRRWQRAVGSSYDADTNGLMLNYLAQLGDGRGWGLKLRQMELGSENWLVAKEYSLTHGETVERLQFESHVQYPIGDTLLRVNAYVWRDKPDGWSSGYDGAVSVVWEARF